ncbi:MAG: alpha/beta hydrolase [Alphaproteobacteria bacterium]|nr:MAG: alpha/beta hydrolase [Alphaproteobacteria bacterium]
MADATFFNEAGNDDAGFVSRFVTAPDGLRLHVRMYGARGRSLPMVCLPGLTRNGADFHAIATALTRDAAQPRLAVTIDSRGRGRSDYDPNPDNYSFPVELADVVAVLTALEIGQAVFLGTSRGGILTMLLGAARPAAIAGAILNDIGPVIETKGLVRIKGYAGKLPMPRDFTEGAEILRRLGDAQFPNLSPESWLRQAKQIWWQENGRLRLAYDAKLSTTLEAVDPERPVPPLWAQFDSLARVPLMVVHGGNSDILSAATVDAMRERRLDIDVLEVPDQGHAPLLAEPDVIARIAAFVTLCDVSALGF